MDKSELEKELADAAEAVRMLERERDERAREAAALIRAEYSERISAACLRRGMAQKAMRDHIDATSSHPWDGKRVFKIEPVYSRWTARQTGTERLDGIVEVVRQSSEFPDNISWSRPSLGQVIVRKVKKDGSPSLQIHKLPGNIMEEWSLVE